MREISISGQVVKQNKGSARSSEAFKLRLQGNHYFHYSLICNLVDESLVTKQANLIICFQNDFIRFVAALIQTHPSLMNYRILNTRQGANVSIPVLPPKKSHPDCLWIIKKWCNWSRKTCHLPIARCFQGPVKGTQSCDTLGQTEGTFALSYYY